MKTIFLISIVLLLASCEENSKKTNINPKHQIETYIPFEKDSTLIMYYDSIFKNMKLKPIYNDTSNKIIIRLTSTGYNVTPPMICALTIRQISDSVTEFHDVNVSYDCMNFDFGLKDSAIKSDSIYKIPMTEIRRLFFKHKYYSVFDTITKYINDIKLSDLPFAIDSNVSDGYYLILEYKHDKQYDCIRRWCPDHDTSISSRQLLRFCDKLKFIEYSGFTLKNQDWNIFK